MRLKTIIAVPKLEAPYLFRFQPERLKGQLNGLHAVIHDLDDAKAYIERKGYQWEKVCHLFDAFRRTIERVN